ncbi:MAG: hypothetical protein QOJ70_1200 [Acidobacteriota bacterium]|jgi:uncharacterized membrane protein|nr:hypothetical protein [Acidobacteriota bacterium]MDT7807387.1 hypothetical protein [Acidobacteriota bacterium]
MTLLFFEQENVRSILVSPGESWVEGSVVTAVQWLKLGIETLGALIIGLGVATAVVQFFRALAPPRVEGFNSIRLTLARYLALALEFQLGADILTTAVAPTWEQIGKLGAIAVIRTGLNYFLTREMRDEQQRPVEQPREAASTLGAMSDER